MADRLSASPHGAPSSKLFANTATVTIFIGPSLKPFNLHLSLLTSKSPYFANLFTAEGWEAHSPPVHISHFSPDLFPFVVEYMYTNTLTYPSFSAEKLSEKSVLALIQLWKMGDYLDMPGLQNQVMAYLHRSFNAETASKKHTALIGTAREDDYQYDMHAYIRACYEGTENDCALRRWVSDLYACGLATTKRGKLNKRVWAMGVEKEFLMDVLWRTDDLRLEMDGSNDLYSFGSKFEELGLTAYEVKEVKEVKKE